MNKQNIEIIEQFFNQYNQKFAKKKIKVLKKTESFFCTQDIHLGISTQSIKDFIHTTNQFDIETITKLVKSEYNEGRILGWALLVRDYPNSEILKYFILNHSNDCANWNVVDFATPIVSKIIFKEKGNDFLQSIGYELIEKNGDNVWSHRFALLISLFLAKNNKLNFPIDIVERSLLTNNDLIQKPCGIVLNEVGLQNKNILKLFLKENKSKISSTIKTYLITILNKEEQHLLFY